LRKTSSKSTVIVLDFVANAKRVMMVREIVERIKAFAPKRTELEKSPFYIKGFFNFVFTDEQIDLLEVLKRLEHKFISDIPELAREYSKRNSLPASEVLAGTNQKVWWKCRKKKCGHEWLASGNNRLNGSGCPACAHQVVTTRNNLVVTHPELAREYSSKNSLPADKVIAGGARKFWWKCSKSWCGFEWRATGQSRVSAVKGNGCPACAHRIVTALNNLAVTHPELAREYSSKNLLPADKVVAGTGKKLWWKCSNGHEWQAKGADRVNSHGCPACWNERRKNG
jgi:DNA-directed RNA polymerase subunit RPC12/RpoP